MHYWQEESADEIVFCSVTMLAFSSLVHSLEIPYKT